MNNLSDASSENENVDDSFEDFEDHSIDSEIIRYVKKCKVAVFSRDSDTDEDNDNCWFGKPPHLQLCSYHYYKSTSIAEFLLLNKTRVLTIREIRGLSPNLIIKTSTIKLCRIK